MTGTGSGPLHEAWQQDPPPTREGIKRALFMDEARQAWRERPHHWSVGMRACCLQGLYPPPAPVQKALWGPQFTTGLSRDGSHILTQGCHGTGPIIYHRVVMGGDPYFTTGFSRDGTHILPLGCHGRRPAPKTTVLLTDHLHQVFLPRQVNPRVRKIVGSITAPFDCLFLDVLESPHFHHTKNLCFFQGAVPREFSLLF